MDPINAFGAFRDNEIMFRDILVAGKYRYST